MDTPTIPPKTAVLLVNLGSPSAATPLAVKAYLAEFLSDSRVIEAPRYLWLPILHGFILQTRPQKSAEKYNAIWRAEGAPLVMHTMRQAKMLEAHLHQSGFSVLVSWAMRYGEPSVAATLDNLKKQGIEKILLLPLYPQYAASTTATVVDEVCRFLLADRNQPAMRWIKDFHDDPGYIAALAASVKSHWAQNGSLEKNDRFLISFHGLPEKSRAAGDPYFDQCHASAKLLLNHLDLSPGQYEIAFQSRFGPLKWLQPYTTDVLKTWGKEGIRRVDVLCPGFVSDCLETLEEIAIEERAGFLKAGGQNYHYIPALNENDDWILALSHLVISNLQGWISKEDQSTPT